MYMLLIVSIIYFYYGIICPYTNTRNPLYLCNSTTENYNHLLFM